MQTFYQEEEVQIDDITEKIWDQEVEVDEQEEIRDIAIQDEAMEEKKIILGGKGGGEREGGKERKRGAKKERRSNQDQEDDFYNNAQSGQELVSDIIDIIRHQQYILDNIDHLKSYNMTLLNIWKKQINLLDAYDRFEYYKSLGKLKELMKQLLLLEGVTIDSLFINNQNEEILNDKEELIKLLIQDLEKANIEIDFERALSDLSEKQGDYKSVKFLREKSQYYFKSNANKNEGEQCCLLDYVQRFCLKIVNLQKIPILYGCQLCKKQFENVQQLLKHCNEEHLKFLIHLLLGRKDKCFSLNCNERRGNQERNNYAFSNHLKQAHSEIYQEDCIFTKLYGKDGNAACDYFYGKDARNWKKKFDRDLFEWLDRVDQGAKQFLIDQGDKGFMSQRGKGSLEGLKSWIQSDQSLMNSEYEGAFGDFDQLCYLLKWSWSSGMDYEVSGLNWIFQKLRPEPKRIFLIEAIAELLDTKYSLISQLHRYIYLGVFNFKLTQKELKFRIVSLQNLIRDLGIFQYVIFNNGCFSKSCLFEEVLCSKHNASFETRLKMCEHYWDFHIGVFYALSSPQLQGNLQGQQNNRTNKEQTNNGRGGQNFRDHNIFQELKMNEVIHYLHDHHQADIKTRSKKFLRICRENFQLKSVCFECKRELHEFGEVYWYTQVDLVKRKKAILVLRHYQSVKQVIEAYQSNCDEEKKQKREAKQREELQSSSIWSELKEIEELSQCKDCYKKLKSFHPLLKELKEEYFTLPGKEEGSEKLEIKKSEPRFIRTQKKVLNKMIEERGGTGWRGLSEEMQSGYFRINSFPKLVQVYGEISEKQNQNPRGMLSQPILKGYMKVIFQTPLIYIRGTSIIYEMKPQLSTVKENGFKLFGSSDVQRKELIEMLESHPIMQNHTYQLSKLTRLCVDQVDLMFRLNKHLLKSQRRNNQKKEKRLDGIQKEQKEEEENQEKIGQELTKTADLLYFEGVLHRAQVSFLMQQFRVWVEVFDNVMSEMKRYAQGDLIKSQMKDSILETLHYELEKFSSLKRTRNDNNNSDTHLVNFVLMIILGMYFLRGANHQMKLSFLKIEKEITEQSSFFDFMFSEHKSNPLRFIIECHVLPIVIPLVEQFVHPIFIGTLMQIFQLNLKRRGWRGIENNSLKQYLNHIYEGLSNLTIKRCLPLFDFYDQHQMKEKKKKSTANEKEKESMELIHQQMSEYQFSKTQQEEGQEEIREKSKRKQKLEDDQRWFQLRLFKKLNDQEIIDMQCRYVLSKRSLIKAMNSEIEEPLIECDLRWAMQIALMFYSSLQKKAVELQDNEQERRAAQQHVQELSDLKKESEDFFNKNRISIPEDFLFKQFKKNGQEHTSDLRRILEEIIIQDQMKGLNQTQKFDNYSLIHRLKIAYFIPMEKKLQDIVWCISKIRAIPHRQAYRSFEKFSKYNFRELEMLAFPELYATGQGFLQFLAPKIERSQIVIDINHEDRSKAQEVLKNLKQFKGEAKQKLDSSSLQINDQADDISDFNSSTFKFQVSLEGFGFGFGVGVGFYYIYYSLPTQQYGRGRYKKLTFG